MPDLSNVTLGDLGRSLARYRPFLALLAAVVLVVGFLPGEDRSEDLAATGGTASETGVTDDTAVDTGATGDAGAAVEGAGDTAVATGDGATGGAVGGTTGGGGGGGTSAGSSTAGGGGTTAVATPTGGAVAVSGEPGPDCDAATGRVRIPSKYAPPCKPAFSGSNGGATSPLGVTEKELTLVVYRAKANAGTQAALSAAGAADDPAVAKETIRAYVDFFAKHYETYGRKIKLIIMDGTGETTDDAAGKADAITIATQHKAFATIGDPNNAFVDELVARKILCICTTSQPQEFYEARNPYAGYTTLMSSTQGYVHRAEYIGKRLAGRPANYADDTIKNDPTYPKQRSFGLLYFETKDRAYEQGIKFFEKELKNKYGVTLAVSAPFTGAIGPGADPSETQKQAGPLITRLKQAKVTSVVYSGDPLSPAIFTKEASNQQYFPEWIITGSALTDTALFGRTYDPLQWRRAFGISFLAARSPQEFGDAFRLHVWHHGKPPAAENTYGVIYSPIRVFFLGVHMAGPQLNPVTWQKGLFSYPVSGAGGITTASSSWGDHGLWEFLDFTDLDDVTEIWWDPQAQGEDETGARGAGLYQFVDGGVRYLPGQHPKTDPKVFTREGAVTIYNTPPAKDTPPDHKHDDKLHRNY